MAPLFLQATPLITYIAPLCLVLLTGVAGHVALQGDRTARLYLASWALLWAGVIARLAAERRSAVEAELFGRRCAGLASTAGLPDEPAARLPVPDPLPLEIPGRGRPV